MRQALSTEKVYLLTMLSIDRYVTIVRRNTMMRENITKKKRLLTYRSVQNHLTLKKVRFWNFWVEGFKLKVDTLHIRTITGVLYFPLFSIPLYSILLNLTAISSVSQIWNPYSVIICIWILAIIATTPYYKNTVYYDFNITGHPGEGNFWVW